MTTLRKVREVASAICVASGNSCIQVDEPLRRPCTYRNCRMMGIGREALRQAKASGPRASRYKLSSGRSKPALAEIE